jgi:hypothetical protein
MQNRDDFLGIGVHSGHDPHRVQYVRRTGPVSLAAMGLDSNADGFFEEICRIHFDCCLYPPRLASAIFFKSIFMISRS